MLASAYQEINVFSDLIALEKGIIHPTIALAMRDDRPHSIDESLASMTTEESRKTRRKFRKMLRSSTPGHVIKKMSKKQKRTWVMMSIRSQAWDLTRPFNNYILSDDDE